MRDDLQALDIPKEIGETFGPYRDDPVGFCTEVLGIESATRRSNDVAYQFDILSDLAHDARVAVRSGHGIGKSAVDAWAAIWWLLTRPMSRVVIVAPEFSRQVRAVLFAEIRKWVRRTKVPLPLNVMASRAIVEGHGDEWGAIGVPATEPDRIEGFHSEAGVLLILDETKGISQDVYDALQGALTSLEDNRLLVTSTPGGPSGPFYRIWTKGERWKLHHIPSTDSSNVDPEWCEERAREWGVGSPLYQARVLGEFPDAGEGVLFPLSLLEKAQQTDLEPSGSPTFGVDVARSIAGDRNALAVCYGGALRGVITWHDSDSTGTIERVLHEVIRRGPSNIYIDATGVGGPLGDRLRQLGHRCIDVHFGGRADDPQRFFNRRAELFWQLREAVDRGEIALPDDEELVADLASIRYEFDQRGRIRLESKDDTRKRLGRSPDRADAVALSCTHLHSDASGPCLVFIGGKILDLTEGRVVKDGIGW
jgi:hypothetical protein